ncbi:hypothetical protein MMC28_005247 [Mycoblastus sanguinarius]|nr:hypothetical protein [Mycoblastus sanguinarius]
MYSTVILPIGLLISAIYAATTDQIIALNNGLTPTIITFDESLVAVTPQTPPATASEIPTNFQKLTAAISSALSQATSTPTTLTTDPTVEFNLEESYGYFANECEELMYDFNDTISLLGGVFGLQATIYGEILTFNTTYMNFTNFMFGVSNDASYQTVISLHIAAFKLAIKAVVPTYV